MDWIVSLLQTACPFCGKTLGSSQKACQDCACKLTAVSLEPTKLFQIQNLPIIVCLDYQDWIRELVLRQKAHPNKIATKWMASLLHEKMPIGWKEIPCVWIPGHPLENIHLVETLALELKHLGQPLIHRPLLFRSLKKMKSQKELSVTQRKNSKRIKKFYISRFFRKHYSKEVLLLDDVMTTGSTLKNCKQLLEENLSLKVIGAIVFAHTPLRNGIT